MSDRRYAIVRVVYAEDTSDHEASELTDQLAEFARACGDYAEIVEEDIAERAEQKGLIPS